MVFFDTVQGMIFVILALIFALIFGYSLTHLPIPILELRWEIWAVVAAASAIGIVLCLIFSRKKKAEDYKDAIKAHLKISILFWSYFTKKEKVKTLEEAKREVIQDVKREFAQIPWMESVIEEIRQELSKYK